MTKGSPFFSLAIKDFLSEKARYYELFVILSPIVACSLSAYFLFVRDQHSLLYYADSVSHLVITRRVFDSLDPSLGLLGSVWLPGTHILLMPFVVNDFLYHTGLAGTIVSTLSTTVTSLILYRIVKLQFNLNPGIGLIACFVYLVNPSLIYMGIVPMMEAPFVMFFVLSAYYLQKLFYFYTHESNSCKNNNNSSCLKVRFSNPDQVSLLIKCSLSISAATLTRYEGWFLPIAFVVLLLFIGPVRIIKRESKGEKRSVVTKDILVALVICTIAIISFSGIILWLIWNSYYYHDPLYFATGPFSAQVESKPFDDYLHLNPILISSVISGVTKSLYGIPILVVSGSGILLYLVTNRKRLVHVLAYLVTLIILAVPLLSVFLAMLQGSAAIYPIENTGGDGWYNGRFAVLFAPLIAFSSGSLVAAFVHLTKRMQNKDKRPVGYNYTSRLGVIVVIIIILFSSLYIFLSQPLEVGYTTAMNDRYTLLPFVKEFQLAFAAGKTLGSMYNGNGQIVLFTPSQSGQEIMFESGLSMKHFINTATGSYWQISKRTPWIFGEYLIMTNSIGGHTDPNNGLINYWTANNKLIMKHYVTIYSNLYYKILERIPG